MLVMSASERVSIETEAGGREDRGWLGCQYPALELDAAIEGKVADMVFVCLGLFSGLGTDK